MAKKLEEIKEEECPYELPDGWKWERLGNIAEVVSGGTPSSKVKEYYNGDIAWITPADLSGYKKRYISHGAKNITKTGLDKSSAKLVPKDTVLLSSRAPIGYVVIAKNELSTNQGFKNFLPSDDYLPQYLYWYLKGNKELLESYASGTTFLELSASKAKMIEFPLAPKKTQQKIVDIIESLFAKLDIVQEKVEQVLAESENRRSAILHKAFSGKLTEKWRKENGVLFDSWKNKAIGEFSFVTKLAGFEYSNNIYPNLCSIGIPLFKGKNVRDGELLLNFESFIPKEVSDELPRSQLNKKCILTPYVGTIGNVAIFDGSFHAHLGSNVGKIEISSDTTEEYLVYYLRSHFGYQELTKEKKATAQESISIKAIRNVSVILPTLPEQKEIVRLLDKLLFVEDKVKSTCQNTLEAIATMRKSILAKAFRRELCS